MHDNLKHLPTNLLVLRVSKRLSQTALADDISTTYSCEVSQSTICRIESGRLEPATWLLLLFADYFKVSVERLIAPTPHV